ncbi:hypothetical protein PUN28_013125 [Cardiocondyla obscurior]|uniref:Secreted protein n=1 Tax=Cardiocondyla obscurior TaxID=286306 RepID=A0AAW2FA55_9HYME
MHSSGSRPKIRILLIWLSRLNAHAVLSLNRAEEYSASAFPRHPGYAASVFVASREIRSPAGVTFRTWVNFLSRDLPKRRVNPFAACLHHLHCRISALKASSFLLLPPSFPPSVSSEEGNLRPRFLSPLVLLVSNRKNVATSYV